MPYFSIKAHKFYVFRNIIGDRKLNVLDVGCGNHSPSDTKKNFKNIIYHGVDLEANPNYFPSDKKAIDKLFIMNLDDLRFDLIENEKYDIIIMCHVIEHLHQGEKVIQHLVNKLKKGGYFYIEFPSERSVNFPSVKGTLNFYDDITHVRVYSIKEIISYFNNPIEIVKSGTVRSVFNLLLTPYKMIKSKITRGYVRAYVLWDLFGFANYILIKK